MMTILAKIFTGIGGSSFTLPIVALIALIGWHQRSKAQQEQVRLAATNICDKAWESEVRRQERDAATAETTAARNLLGAERQLNEGLNNELARLNMENTKLLGSGVDSDSRCLSDSVLRSLGGSADRVPGKTGSGGANSGRQK